jgi:hypothetical protein
MSKGARGRQYPDTATPARTSPTAHIGSGIWIALAWSVGVLIAAYSFSIVTYRRRIS